MREVAAQVLALAEKQGATVPLIIGHRLMGISCCIRETLRKAVRISIARWRFTILPSIVRWRRDFPRTWGWQPCLSVDGLWMLGYPEAALADAERALTDAREIGQAATLMDALFHTSMTHIACGKYATANALLNELVALADEKGSSFWNAQECWREVALSR